MSNNNTINLGEDIAFGIQQTATCLATDFIDPFVGAWVQKRLGGREHTSTLAHTITGEVAGDGAALVIFIALQKTCPSITQHIQQFAAKHFAKTYEKMAESSVRPWAEKHNISPDSEEYCRKIEEWKNFQASNFAKSSVISIGSIISNVVVQKWAGNPNNITTITASKAIGAAITMGSVLGMRAAFPHATHKLDKEMNRRFISPIIEKTRHMLGMSLTTEAPLSYTQRITNTANNTATAR